MEKPEVGTKMYFVEEHLYHVPGHAGTAKEYCVCMGEVTGFYTGGYTEVLLRGKNPDGAMTPYYFRLTEIGEKVFYTPQEAAMLARYMTERYERTWRWLGEPEIPMRRPWAGSLRKG